MCVLLLICSVVLCELQVLNDNDNIIEPLAPADELRGDKTSLKSSLQRRASGSVGEKAPKVVNGKRERAPSTERIDVVIGGDSNYWPGMFAATKSIVESASRATQRRLHVHLLVDVSEGAEQLGNMRLLVNCSLASGAMMRDVGVSEPFLSLLEFDSRDFARNIKWSQAKNSLLRNLTSPHNFARFYLADYLPRAVRKIVWLDADVIVRSDIGALFDATLRDDDRRNLVFAACTSMRRFDFMLDMSPGSKLVQRMPALAKCYQQNCDHFNAGVSMIRVDRWRERNITAQVEDWIDFLNQHPKLVVGLTQPLLFLVFFEQVERISHAWNVAAKDYGEQVAIDDAKLLHLNGHRKPWFILYGVENGSTVFAKNRDAIANVSEELVDMRDHEFVKLWKEFDVLSKPEVQNCVRARSFRASRLALNESLVLAHCRRRQLGSGKKTLYVVDHGRKVVKSFGWKSVEADADEPWRVQRVYEKQRRDFVFEAALLQRFNATRRNGARFLPHIYEPGDISTNDNNNDNDNNRFSLANTDECVRLLRSTRVIGAARYDRHDAISATIVDYIPVQFGKLIKKLHEDVDSNWKQMLHVALQLAQFIQSMEFGIVGDVVDSQNQQQLGFDKYVLCDWKVDQFAFLENDDRYALKLIDVDSLAPYMAGTRFHERQMCDIQQSKLSACVSEFGCFRNSFRLQYVGPGEYFCNDTTNLCDGYDGQSNVWGAAHTTLSALFGVRVVPAGATSALTLSASDARVAYGELTTFVQRMVSTRASDRPTPLECLKFFEKLYRQFGGDDNDDSVNNNEETTTTTTRRKINEQQQQQQSTTVTRKARPSLSPRLQSRTLAELAEPSSAPTAADALALLPLTTVRAHIDMTDPVVLNFSPLSIAAGVALATALCLMCAVCVYRRAVTRPAMRATENKAHTV